MKAIVELDRSERWREAIKYPPIPLEANDDVPGEPVLVW